MSEINLLNQSGNLNFNSIILHIKKKITQFWNHFLLTMSLLRNRNILNCILSFALES